MARITDYEQDEDKPFGYGTFKLDDGSEYYLDDPPRAREFLEQVEKETGSILSEPVLSTKDRYDNAASKLAQGPAAAQVAPRARFTRPDPLRGAVAGPGGGEDESLMSIDPSSSQSREPDRSEAEPRSAGAPAELSPEELRQQEEARRTQALIASVDPYKRTPGVDPRRMQAEGVPVERTFSRKGGVPVEVYNQQATDRAAAYDATNETLIRHQQEDQARAAAEGERLRSEALAMKHANDQQQLLIQRKQDKYQSDRQWLEKEVDGYYDKNKPDPDGGLRKARGPIGNIASAIAQFMGAYAAIVSGSPNFANQILNRKIDEHVDAQIEGFKRGRMKLDGQMQRMAERGMSIDQMRSALKLQQELVIQRETKAAALAEGTREAKQAAEALLMERQERFVSEENKFRIEALGENTVSGEMVQPRAPGAVRKTPDEIIREATARQKGVNDLGYEVQGGAPAEREREREAKRGETADKKSQAFENQVSEYSKRREAIPDLNKVDSAAARLRAIDKTNGGFPGIGTLDNRGVPFTDRRELADEVEQLRQTMLNAVISAKPGNKSDADALRIAKEGLSPDATEDEFRRGVAIARQYAVDARNEIEAGASEEVRSAYNERLKKIAIERAKKKAQGDRSTGEVY